MSDVVKLTDRTYLPGATLAGSPWRGLRVLGLVGVAGELLRLEPLTPSAVFVAVPQLLARHVATPRLPEHHPPYGADRPG
jgi:hypothetical protein